MEAQENGEQQVRAGGMDSPGQMGPCLLVGRHVKPALQGVRTHIQANLISTQHSWGLSSPILESTSEERVSAFSVQVTLAT